MPNYPYNLTNLSSSMDILEFTENINSLSGNLLGLAFLIMIFAITFIVMSHRTPKESFAYATWMTFVMAFFLQLLGFISGTIFIVTLILLAGSVVWLVLDKN